MKKIFSIIFVLISITFLSACNKSSSADVSSAKEDKSSESDSATNDNTVDTESVSPDGTETIKKPKHPKLPSAIPAGDQENNAAVDSTADPNEGKVEDEVKSILSEIANEESATDELIDCGDDVECLNNLLYECKNAISKAEGDLTGGTRTVARKTEENLCLYDINMKSGGSTYTMNCKFPLDLISEVKDKLYNDITFTKSYCTGNLLTPILEEAEFTKGLAETK